METLQQIPERKLKPNFGKLLAQTIKRETNSSELKITRHELIKHFPNTNFALLTDSGSGGAIYVDREVEKAYKISYNGLDNNFRADYLDLDWDDLSETERQESIKNRYVDNRNYTDREARIHQKLSNHNAAPKFYDFIPISDKSNRSIMVMEVLDKNTTIEFYNKLKSGDISDEFKNKIFQEVERLTDICVQLQISPGDTEIWCKEGFELLFVDIGGFAELSPEYINREKIKDWIKVLLGLSKL